MPDFLYDTLTVFRACGSGNRLCPTPLYQAAHKGRESSRAMAGSTDAIYGDGKPEGAADSWAELGGRRGGGEGGTALPTDVNNPHVWQSQSSSSFFPQAIHHFPLYAEPEKHYFYATKEVEWNSIEHRLHRKCMFLLSSSQMQN